MIAAIAMIALSLGAVLEIVLAAAIRSRTARRHDATTAAGVAQVSAEVPAVSGIAEVSGR